ncbi:MAG: O-methyltransferase [Candidatus Limnocylindrales bacterium]
MSLRSYLNRPAKSIERLMLVEAFRRLSAFGPLSQYAYVGFGAHEFVDFELMWRTLGITKMTSIEKDAPLERFLFNRPFGSIVVEPGTSRTVLPRMIFEPHTIVWLDYTRKLSREVIADVVDCARRLESGSLLVATVNVEPEPQLTQRRAAVVRRVGEELVPTSVTNANLYPWGLARLSYDIVADQVAQAMRSRVHPARFEQLFNFTYADNAKMLTWGGLVVADGDRPQLAKAQFQDLDYVRTGQQSYDLTPPALTLREMLRLNDALPLVPGSASPLSWLSQDELDAYSRLHRWYPSLP